MSTTSEPSLYARLGGEAALARIVSAFYDRVLADAELEPFFRSSSMGSLRKMQAEFLGAALDGPQVYTGLSLAKSHAGRGITVAHFNRFAQHLLATLREAGVSEHDVQQVIDRVSTYVGDITGQGSFGG